MTFSEFAKALYTYYGNGEKQTDFVIRLTDKIMGGRPGREHKDGTFQNPLRSKDNRTLLSYFNGERRISQGDAGIILSSSDKYKFEEYLRNQCSEDAQKLLKQDISKIEKINDNQDIVEACADIFVSILQDLAKKK